MRPEATRVAQTMCTNLKQCRASPVWPFGKACFSLSHFISLIVALPIVMDVEGGSTSPAGSATTAGNEDIRSLVREIIAEEL